jgi:predicted amidohydrolase YtcJ
VTATIVQRPVRPVYLRPSLPAPARAGARRGRHTRRRWHTPLLVAGLLAAIGSARAQAPVATPDLVLLGGKVFTADSARPWAEAVAIRGDRVVAVGSTAEVTALAGPATRRVPLGGRVVVPGFNDAHVHVRAGWGGVSMALGTGPFADPSVALVLDSIAAGARRTPLGTWLTGGVGPTVLRDTLTRRAALDRVAPDHPVRLSGATGHGMLFNSAALRALAVPDDARDPAGGWYERDAAGRVTGAVWEYAVRPLSLRGSGSGSDTAQAAAITRYAAAAVQVGLTSVQNMVGSGSDPRAWLRGLRVARPAVRFRVIRQPTPADAGGGFAVWDAAERATPVAGVPGATVGGVKYILDATPVDQYGVMRRRWGGYPGRPGWYGRANFPTDTVRAMLRAALAAPPGPGRQLMLHVAGDSMPALVMALMTELGPDSAWVARRVRFEHGDFLMADQRPLARRLGIVVVPNPVHFSGPQSAIRAAWGAMATEMTPLRSLVAAGIPVAIGSDGPMNPLLNVMLASTHPTNPAEALTREQAVIAYTRGSAYAEYAERDKGTLAPGMLADLAVLSQDIFVVPAAALPATTSVLTLVAGRVVFDAGVLAAAGAATPTSGSAARHDR